MDVCPPICSMQKRQDFIPEPAEEPQALQPIKAAWPLSSMTVSVAERRAERGSSVLTHVSPRSRAATSVSIA